jgi:hypothetical protein
MPGFSWWPVNSTAFPSARYHLCGQSARPVSRSAVIASPTSPQRARAGRLKIQPVLSWRLGKRKYPFDLYGILPYIHLRLKK